MENAAVLGGFLGSTEFTTAAKTTLHDIAEESVSPSDSLTSLFPVIIQPHLEPSRLFKIPTACMGSCVKSISFKC